MAGQRGVRIGLALGEDRAVAVVLGRRGAPTASASLALGQGPEEMAETLTTALTELRARLAAAGAGSTEGATAHVVLLPPLADARVIPFPPMSRPEVEAVLVRDVARYFVGANRPRVVGFRLPGGNGGLRNGGEGGSVPVLAAAAPTALLESARQALARVGWRAGSFAAAHGGWMEAASASKGTPVKAIVAVVGSAAHVLRMEGPDARTVRKLPADDVAAIAHAAGDAVGRVVVLSSPQRFEDLQGALASKGWIVSRDPEGWPGAEEGAAARATLGGLELTPPTMALERREKAQRRTAYLVGGALLCVLLSAAAQLWGVHRELTAVQARRAEIRTQVAPLLDARDSLTLLSSRVQSLEEIQESSPLWTRSLVELAAVLPQNTHLTGFFASGDTVELEAAGTEAGAAIQALRESGLFEEVRLQGIVERELDEGATVEERFRLWARLPARGEEGS